MLGPDQALVDPTTRTLRTNFNRHSVSDLESIIAKLKISSFLFLISHFLIPTFSSAPPWIQWPNSLFL